MLSYISRSALLCVLVSSFALLAASCGDDEAGGGNIDAAASIDADPNAPDADPNAPDADPNAPDADPNAPDADPSAPDAQVSTPDAGTGVTCGDMTCTGTDICCTTQGGGGGGFSQTCTASDQCMGSPSECDGPEDCGANEVCCGSLQGAQCQATACQTELCHDTADCTDAADTCCGGFGGTMICSQFCF